MHNGNSPQRNSDDHNGDDSPSPTAATGRRYAPFNSTYLSTTYAIYRHDSATDAAQIHSDFHQSSIVSVWRGFAIALMLIFFFFRLYRIEQQLNTDQNGAAKPDIHHPFKDKADACKRLIRYHCFDQPVLSIKDLNKADEIFELTAKHFIDKFSKMVDKYRFLRSRESMVSILMIY